MPLRSTTHVTLERSNVKRLSVVSIITPMEKDVPLQPSVGPGDPITHAVELMLKKNLRRIAVIEETRPIGMISLDDALKKLGLEKGLKSKGQRAVVFQGRKFIVAK